MKPRWYEIAEGEVGIKEIPGDKAEARIIEYHSHTTLKATSDEVAWCSAFVNFCVDRAGLKGTHSAAARSWLQWGVPVQPTEGCIVVMSRGSNPAQGHVGFYAGENASLVRILGGNQHDSVCYSYFPKSHVLGYRWPEDMTTQEAAA